MAAALVVIGLSIVAFGDLSEDVTHNTDRPPRRADLHFFIHHRHAVPHPRRQLGAILPGARKLALLARRAAALLWRAIGVRPGRGARSRDWPSGGGRPGHREAGYWGRGSKA